MEKSNQRNIMYLNGSFTPIPLSSNPINQYSTLGYAAYEGIRAYNTHNGARLFKSKEHFTRLEQSCAVLGIKYDFDVYELIDETYQLLEKNRLRNAYVRITVSNDSSIAITAHEWNYFLANRPLNLGISSHERPNPNSVPVNAKISGNTICNILASKEVKGKGFDEALLLDINGNIAQASTANIFFEKNGKIYTPSLGHVFPGITRAVVFEICERLNLQIIEKKIKPTDISKFDSAFLCGTRTEITGVARIDTYAFSERWENTLGASIQRAFINRVLEQENYEVII